MKKFLVLIFLLVPGLCLAQSMTVTWEPSPTPDIDGYVIYCGQDSRPSGVTSPEDDVFQYLFTSGQLPPETRSFTFDYFPPGHAYCSAVAFKGEQVSVYSAEAENYYAGYETPNVKHPPTAEIIIAPGEAVILRGGQ